MRISRILKTILMVDFLSALLIAVKELPIKQHPIMKLDHITNIELFLILNFIPLGNIPLPTLIGFVIQSSHDC